MRACHLRGTRLVRNHRHSLTCSLCGSRHFTRSNASSFQAVCVQRICRDFIAVNIPSVQSINNRFTVYHQFAVHANTVFLRINHKREHVSLASRTNAEAVSVHNKLAFRRAVFRRGCQAVACHLAVNVNLDSVLRLQAVDTFRMSLYRRFGH